MSSSSTPAVSSPRPCVFGFRPVANITMSTTAGSWFAMLTFRQPSSSFSIPWKVASKRNSSPFIMLIWSSRSRICRS